MRKIILASMLAMFFYGAFVTGAQADNREEAKKHYTSGNTHFKLARFDEALAQYSKAYEMVPIPGLLFNIAQCHANLKNHEGAVFFFEGYLRETPDAADRRAVLKLITESKQAIEAKRIADEETKRAADEESKRVAEEEGNRRRQEREAAEEAKRREAAPKFMPKPIAATGPVGGGESAPMYKKWWFWSVIGGAALAVGGGVILATSGDTVLPSGSLGTLDRRQ